MHCTRILAALLGSLSLVAAAPTSVERDATPAEKGLRHKTKRQLGALIQPNIQISNTQITVVNQNLGVIGQLARLAEQQLAALVQSQIQLVTQLETIKNNIRINHFKARFSQVNAVIVTVTNVIDARDAANVNRRYLMNQLRIDNGVPDKELVVMVTQKEEMTISATPTVNVANLAASASAGFTAPTGVSKVINFDPNTPFPLFNSPLILPYNTSAPTNALVLEDPANIIFAGNHNLLVESVDSLQADCLQLAATNSLVNQAIQLSLFNSFQQASAAQLAGLQIGGGIPIIPPSILQLHPELAAQYSQEVATPTATETAAATEAPAETATATETAIETAAATETVATSETVAESATGSATATPSVAAQQANQGGHGGHGNGKGRKENKENQANTG